MTEFPCYRCGACCRNVHLAIETAHLDRGDGCCRHYDEKQKLCLIYSDRPDICRINVQYAEKYINHMSWESFCAINLEACRQLEKLVASRNVDTLVR